MMGRVGENKGAKREKVSEFVGFLEASKSTRSRMNPHKHARVGIKKPNRERLGFHYWWRRRELNPRPQAFLGQIYMFSALF